MFEHHPGGRVKLKRNSCASADASLLGCWSLRVLHSNGCTAKDGSQMRQSLIFPTRSSPSRTGLSHESERRVAARLGISVAGAPT